MENVESKNTIDIFHKYRKLFYIASMLCFSFLGINSPIKLFAMLLIIIGVILSPFRLRSIHNIERSKFVIAGIIIIFYSLVNSQTFDLMFVCNLLMSLFFLIHTIDIVHQKMISASIHKPTINNSINKLSTVEIVIITLSSVIVMTFFSTSSPLYAINFWDDSNIYFTLGRGITKGIIPYKDVFEQKGPYLHFIYAISAMISYSSFVGVYIFEVLACFTFNVFAWKTVHLFYKPNKYSLILIPIFTTIAYLVIPFHFGGSAEEFCFPILTIIIYIACKAEINNRLPNNKETAIIGLLTGFLLFTKFTACGLIFGYIIYVLIRTISSGKSRRLPIMILLFIGGILIITIPVLIYFGINNAIEDLFNIYFYNNIFSYSSNGSPKTGILLNISYLMSTSEYTFYGLVLSLFSVVGLNKNIRIMYLVMLLAMSASIYLPGTYYYYYSLILTALTIPAFIMISVLWENLCHTLHSIRFRPDIIASVLAIIILVISFSSQRNFDLITKKTDDIPQYLLGDIIKQTPNAKLLTYDVMDAGFFLCSNTLPSTWYYCHTNTYESNPEFRQMQEEEIAKGFFDYIITLSDSYNWDGYKIIASADFHATDRIQISIDDKRDYTYYLYARE